MITISTERPKARKRHVCDLCGCPIEIGQVYERQTNHDGYIYTSKCHTECVHAISALDMEECDDDGVTQHDFREIVWDHVCENHPEWETLSVYDQVKNILMDLETDRLNRQ